MRKLSLILAIVLIAVTLNSLGCAFPGVAFAASEEIDVSKYTYVWDDLNRDDTFEKTKEQHIPSDTYGLKFIQIAESFDNELFVYVSWHSNVVVEITSVNISTAINDSLKYVNYKLVQLSTFEDDKLTFGKFKVVDLVVKSDVLRYYDISSIFRRWDSSHDTAADEVTENKILEVSYEVAKLYTAVTVDGNVTYSETHSEVVTITDKYLGYLRYSNGFKLYTSACDSHYVAFSTDHKIDRLYEADIFFISKECIWTRNAIGKVDSWSDDPVNHELTLRYTESASNPANGLFGHKYTWHRIEAVSDFVVNENLQGSVKDSLMQKQWVLRFYESDYGSFDYGVNGAQRNWTEVSELTILRLKFETNGIVYNLGVVDNKQSEPEGGNSPSNSNTSAWAGIIDSLNAFFDRVESFFDKVGVWLKQYWWVIVLGAVVLILLIVAIVYIAKHGIKAFFRVVWWLLKWVLKILWYVITVVTLARPIVFIARKIRERRNEKGQF